MKSFAVRIDKEVGELIQELRACGSVTDENEVAITRFAKATAYKVPEFRGEPEPTYVCPECRDTGDLGCTAGYARLPPKSVDGRQYDQVWFCGCHKGQQLEIAHWLDAVYPMDRSGKRRLNKHGRKNFDAYSNSAWPFAKNMSILFSQCVAKLVSERSITD